jgi:hypothetical protein
MMKRETCERGVRLIQFPPCPSIKPGMEDFEKLSEIQGRFFEGIGREPCPNPQPG